MVFCAALSGIPSLAPSLLRASHCDQPSCRDSSGTGSPAALWSGPARRLGITLKHHVKGGRCPFALGTPVILGAHNSDTLMQQPDSAVSLRIHPESALPERFQLTPFAGARQAVSTNNWTNAGREATTASAQTRRYGSMTVVSSTTTCPGGRLISTLRRKCESYKRIGAPPMSALPIERHNDSRLSP